MESTDIQVSKQILSFRRMQLCAYSMQIYEDIDVLL